MKKIVLLLSVLLLTSQAQAKQISEVCSLIASYNSTLAVDCVKAISTGAYFDTHATDLCYNIANNNVNMGLACVKAIANNSYQEDAVAVCSMISTYNYNTATQCISTIANKSYLNGTAGLCLKIAQNNINSGLQCMAESGVANAKICPKLRDLSTGINNAIDAIYNGTPRVALRILQEMQSKIDACLQ